MANSPIKKARLLAGMTQVETANSMGISQPTYQRWEAGAASVPKGRLGKLAKVLGATTLQLAGKPEAFDLFGCDESIGDEHTYFGEVSIHFRSGSTALLLPISVSERSTLHSVLQGNDTFIEVTSLDNRTVFIRRKAIADVFFSSEAYDDYGPDDYGDQHLGIYPDNSFWKIVEHYEDLESLEGEFNDKEIEDAIKNISMTESDLDALIANGSIRADERSKVRDETKETIERFVKRAQCVTWQLSGSGVRCVSVIENKELYESFSILTLSDEDEMVYFAPEGYHRSIFISLATIDYISVPTHKFREGQIESNAEEMGETL